MGPSSKEGTREREASREIENIQCAECMKLDRLHVLVLLSRASEGAADRGGQASGLPLRSEYSGGDSYQSWAGGRRERMKPRGPWRGMAGWDQGTVAGGEITQLRADHCHSP